MHILVTGGAGYIGSHVVKQLLESTEHDITLLDSFVGGHRSTVDVLRQIKQQSGHQGQLTAIEADLGDFEQIDTLLKEGEYDAVIHFAAHLVVPESVSNPLKYYINNTVNTTHLIGACCRYSVNRFIFSSTAAVYGEPEEVPIKESTPTNPINPYGMSKLMSERVLQDCSAAYNAFSYVILRYFNVAGADMLNRIGECHEPETHLVPLIAQTALGKREKIMMFGEDYATADGSCIRDYVHVEDLADAHIKALEYLEADNESDVFNCGYGHGFSVKEVLEAAKAVSGNDFSVEVAPRRPGDPAVLVSDNSKIISKMQWQPKYDDLTLILQTALAWETKRERTE